MVLKNSVNREVFDKQTTGIPKLDVTNHRTRGSIAFDGSQEKELAVGRKKLV
jgi:hypothetical protein